MSGLRVNFGFIPMPIAIVDEGLDLSLGEVRLLMYLLRHRFRVKSEQLRMTQEELLRGVRSPSGGRWDQGCRITSGRDLKAARERLEARGWLRVQADNLGGMIFELQFNDDAESSASANCTEPSASANCSDGECNMSQRQVQNALEVIRKRSEKREVKQKPAPAVIEADAATGGNRRAQQQKASCEVEASPRLTLVAPEPKASTDPRFAECVAAVKKYVEHMNCVFQWGDAEGKQLKLLLAKTQTMTVDTFRICLQSRARSPVSHGSPPCTWLPTLLEYQAGPLDRFKVPQGGRDGTGNGVAGGNGSGSTRTDGNYAAAIELWNEMYGTAAATG